MNLITIVNKKNHIPSLNDYYIGRGSVLGNSFSHIKSGHAQIKEITASRAESISKFKKDLEAQIKDGNPFICHAINELIIRYKTKQATNYVCFCSPLSCHGEIIKEYVKNAKYCINWFSNMRGMDSPIIHQGIKYWTVENFYQSMKIPRDQIDLRKEFSAKNPYQAKTEIRNIEWCPTWDREKSLKVMEYALRHKFAPNTSWGEKLQACNFPIVETNNWSDTFWGVDIFTGQGDNHLGKLLTKIKEKY